MKDLFRMDDCDVVDSGGMVFTTNPPKYSPPIHGISLTRANEIFAKWLSAGTEVWCKQNGDNMRSYVQTWQNSTQTIYGSEATHRAILVAVEPLVRDSERKVLEDLAGYHGGTEVAWEGLVERARKLLKEGE